jgi:Na+/phosphate symporter
MDLTEQGRVEILNLHDSLTAYLDFILKALSDHNSEILSRAKTESQALRRKMKNFRGKHMNRLAAMQTSPMMSLIYMDLLNSYRRMLDHAFNIAEVVAGGK